MRSWSCINSTQYRVENHPHKELLDPRDGWVPLESVSTVLSSSAALSTEYKEVSDRCEALPNEDWELILLRFKLVYDEYECALLWEPLPMDDEELIRLRIFFIGFRLRFSSECVLSFFSVEKKYIACSLALFTFVSASIFLSAIFSPKIWGIIAAIVLASTLGTI